jgi:hypothetical protein
MNFEEKKKRIDNKQKYIDALPYASTIPYPYCCVCFKRLTPRNITEENGELIDVCISCNNHEKKLMKKKV